MSESGSDNRLALPLGFRFEEFQIVKILGQGGFGITYLAKDLNLQSLVAIKEMLPIQFATRVEGYTVIPQRRSDEEAFTWARSRFLEEARILASLSHGNIVRVLRLLERHGTAYMIMEFVHGKSFMEWIHAHPKPTEEELKGVLYPLLDGLEHVHQRPKKPLLHRDISPENILIPVGRGPVLLDFGSARGVLDRDKKLTSMVREGYSPIEQYAMNVAQGPYTDLYALAAVMIHAITGKQPPTAADRFSDPNSFQPLSRRYRGHYGENLLSALDMAFAFKMEDRPRNVTEFRKLLDGSALPTKQLPVTRKGASSEKRDTSPKMVAPRTTGRRKAFIWLAALALLCAGGVSIGLYYLLEGENRPNGGEEQVPPPTPRLLREPVTASTSTTTSTPIPLTPAPRTPRLAAPISANYTVPTLGMEFVPAGAPPGKKVLLCAYQTRKRDYQAYVEANRIPLVDSKHRWDQAKFQDVALNSDPECPVVNVSWNEANAFCKWLKTLDPAIRECRLPTWDEYSAAWGNARFPWGDTWPPKGIALGNYADKATETRFGPTMHGIPDYQDGFATLAPVKSFKPIRGLYGLGSNVKEWCGDNFYSKNEPITVGASWADGSVDKISRYKDEHDYSMRVSDPEKEEHWSQNARAEWIGFRCVVELSSD